MVGEERTSRTSASAGVDAADGFAALRPLDEHNRVLQHNTHPPDWTNPTPTGRYNLVVIGAGTAGLVSAAGAAGLGAKVALIERHLTGGDCLNVGCVPSKALIRCARAAADARRAGAYGVRIEGNVEVDFAAVMERMRRLRAQISPNDSVQRFADLKIDVYLGQGTFTGPDSIDVNGTRLQFARAVIATGGRPAVPEVPGLRESGYLTNQTLFSLTELPRRLAVFGAGPIGCEMAQCFARFGSQVTLIESGRGILPREDAEAAKIVEASLRRDGVRIVFGGEAASVRIRDGVRVIELGRSGDTHDGRDSLRAPAQSAERHDGQDHERGSATDAGRERVGGSAESGGREQIIADAILVAAGRRPNVDSLGLEAAGVAYDDRSGVRVDDHLRTTNPAIFAAGDVCSKLKFTHTADAQARIVISNALFLGRGRASALHVPWCTYTDPEVAHAGIGIAEAAARGIALRTIRVDLKDVDRAILDGDGDGFLKVHLRAGTDKIVGATLVAPHAGEMISEITLAMTAGIGLGTIARTIHPYPTQADIIKRAADAYNRTRLTPRIKSLMTRFLAWRR